MGRLKQNSRHFQRPSDGSGEWFKFIVIFVKFERSPILLCVLYALFMCYLFRVGIIIYLLCYVHA